MPYHRYFHDIIVSKEFKLFILSDCSMDNRLDQQPSSETNLLHNIRQDHYMSMPQK